MNKIYILFIWVYAIAMQRSRWRVTQSRTTYCFTNRSLNFGPSCHSIKASIHYETTGHCSYEIISWSKNWGDRARLKHSLSSLKDEICNSTLSINMICCYLTFLCRYKYFLFTIVINNVCDSDKNLCNDQSNSAWACTVALIGSFDKTD